MACGGWNGTLTSISVYSNGTDVSYIAIGYQQWGNATVACGGTAVTFNIAFTTTNICLQGQENGCIGSDWDRVDGIGSRIDSASQCTFSSGRASTASIFWMALGIQQWGLFQDNGSSNRKITVSFPISFASTGYIVVTTAKNKTTPSSINTTDYNTTINTLSTSSFEAWIDDKTPATYWFCIGLQQWGYHINTRTANHVEQKITFPLSFASADYTLVRTNQIAAFTSDAQINASAAGDRTRTAQSTTYYSYSQSWG